MNKRSVPISIEQHIIIKFIVYENMKQSKFMVYCMPNTKKLPLMAISENGCNEFNQNHEHIPITFISNAFANEKITSLRFNFQKNIGENHNGVELHKNHSTLDSKVAE